MDKISHLLGPSNTLNFSTDFECSDSFLSSFIDNFHLPKGAVDVPDYENYSFLVFLLIALVKQYNSLLTLVCISPVHYKILIDKNLPLKVLDSFLKIIDELTLSSVNIIDNASDNQWVYDLLF